MVIYIFLIGIGAKYRTMWDPRKIPECFKGYKRDLIGTTFLYIHGFTDLHGMF